MAEDDSTALATALLDALDAPTCAVGQDGVLLSVNRAWSAMATANGGREETCSVGSDYLAVCSAVPPSSPDAVDAAAVAAGLRDVLASRTRHFQRDYACQADSLKRWFSVRMTPLELDGARGAAITHIDISALRVVQEALSHQALHDPLTGLPNRVLLDDRLQQAGADTERRGGRLAVAFLDLDRFKRINDTMGHEAGDTLLVLVADRLAARLRAGDTLCRYAGDEFVVLWRELSSEREAVELCRRLLTSFEDPFPIGDELLTVTASTGLAVGQPPHQGRELLVAADATMYDAKREGPGLLRVVDEERRQRARRAAHTGVALGGAVRRDELVVHYQPLVELASGEPVAVEALVRWDHPQLGLQVPAAFLPVGEVGRPLHPLSRWLLDRVCRDVAGLDRARPGLDVLINLSARQLLEPDLVQLVREALRRGGIDPQRLVCQVVETALITDEESTALALAELTRLGVRIGLDGFGAGSSSLLYLGRYPISLLTLERAVVAGVAEHLDDLAVASSVVALGRSTGAVCVAAGVETAEQGAVLLGLGCALGQGHLWSPAVPLAQLSDAFAACRAVPALVPRRSVPVPQPVSEADRERIVALHLAGASLRTISTTLHRVGSPGPGGDRWSATAVARVLLDDPQS